MRVERRVGERHCERCEGRTWWASSAYGETCLGCGRLEACSICAPSGWYLLAVLWVGRAMAIGLGATVLWACARRWGWW